MKVTPNCTHACRDGSPCGRKVTDGSQPPVCHIHRAKAEGRAVSPLIPTDDDADPIRILRRLARNSDPRVSLRAVDLLLEVDKKPKLDGRLTSGHDFLAALTVEERADLDGLMARYFAIRAAVFDRRPDLRPAHEPVRVVMDEPEPEPPVATVAPPTPRVRRTPPARPQVVRDDVVYLDGVEDV